jgi:hypothetical protein
MRFLVLGIFFWCLDTQAIEWNGLLRYDQIQSRELTASTRLLLQSDLLFKFEKFQFYLDGFAEADGADTPQRNWRRYQDNAYLREAYGEFQSGALFIRIGRQSARWSDSWILPSLDVWTSRRFERLFWEPLSFQLSHSSGFFISYARPKWSLDAALVWDPSRDTYPEPFPKYTEEKRSEGINGGLRLKLDLAGVQSNWVLAQSFDQQTLGFGLNYAFDHWVPKMEIGTTYNNKNDDLIENRNLNFASLGLDFFYNSWTLTPQMTYFENENPYFVTDPQTLYYLLVQYDSNYHQFQIQGFINDTESSNYGSMEYTYKMNSKWSLTGFLQNYYGFDPLSLSTQVYNEFGGTFVGTKIQYNLSSTR